MLAFEGRQVFSPLLRSICSAFSSRPTPVAAPPRKKLLPLARLTHFLMSPLVASPSITLPPRARIGSPGGMPGGPPIGGGGGPPGPAMGSGPAAGPPGAGPPPFGRTIAMLVLPPPFLTRPPRANRCDDLLPAISLSRDAALLLVSLLKAWPLACFSAPAGEPLRIVPTRRWATCCSRWLLYG